MQPLVSIDFHNVPVLYLFSLWNLFFTLVSPIVRLYCSYNYWGKPPEKNPVVVQNTRDRLRAQLLCGQSRRVTR